MRTRADVSGERFGRLVVIKKEENSPARNSRWECVCECGGKITVALPNLRSGGTRSCGCLRREFSKKINYSHGMTGTPIYRIWGSMLKRCRNSNDPNYHRYGGRGIAVCDRWLSFENFLLDMGERPEGLTLDRANNDGDYEPGNCRWVTRLEQMNNTRRNKLVFFEGETKTLAQWCREKGLNYNKAKHRLNRGWEPEKAFA